MRFRNDPSCFLCGVFALHVNSLYLTSIYSDYSPDVLSRLCITSVPRCGENKQKTLNPRDPDSHRSINTWTDVQGITSQMTYAMVTNYWRSPSQTVLYSPVEMGLQRLRCNSIMLNGNPFICIQRLKETDSVLPLTSVILVVVFSVRHGMVSCKVVYFFTDVL